MQKLKRISRYFSYLAVARKKHGIHSPFVFEFVNEVLCDKTDYPVFQMMKEALDMHKQSGTILEFSDFGAHSGSKKYKVSHVRVSTIAKRSAISKKYGRLLFRIVKHFKPQFMLELGTCFGIGSMYMAMGNPEAKLITIEGCANTAELATQNFQRYDLDMIELVEGEFSTVLPGALSKLPRLDLAFVDGNHRYEPTMKYFNMLLQKAHDQTILIFDDIHWSDDMQAAWKQIIVHPQVSVSIDLYRFGVVFTNPGLSKQDFVLRY
jgi:predicted O-methyltransferase YrrM